MGNYSFMLKFRSTVLGLTLVATTGACNPPRGTDFSQIYSAPGTFTAVDFATLQAQVLAPKCLSCHADFATAQGIQPYITPGDPKNSALYTEIANGDMPPGGPALPEASLQIVAQYIDGLAGQEANVNENNPDSPEAPAQPQPSPSPSSSGVTFNQLKQAVLQSKCMECHQDFDTEQGLAPYVVAGHPEKSSLYQSASSGQMPPGGPKLSEDDLAMIKTYISGL